ncbi:hypothetical protein Droror1_Dr00000325 [Drosera rotundifolia]
MSTRGTCFFAYPHRKHEQTNSTVHCVHHRSSTLIIKTAYKCDCTNYSKCCPMMFWDSHEEYIFPPRCEFTVIFTLEDFLATGCGNLRKTGPQCDYEIIDAMPSNSGIYIREKWSQ